MDENKKRKYRKQYHCSNCGMDYMETFNFGEIATQGECPHCGVSPHQIEREVQRPKY